MTCAIRIALIGDYNPAVTAHVAIPKALALVSAALGRPVEPVWIPTETLDDDPERRFAEFDGLWCVPATPYVNTDGALRAIRYARESGRPFLGTCGGFQNALIEYARDVLGIAGADHAETNPEASVLFVSRLSCSLVEVTGKIHLPDGTRMRDWYGCAETEEGYHCNFGLNPAYESALEGADLNIVARDENREVRAVELAGHPFFVGTLFQPERAGLRGVVHPVVRAFVEAARSSSSTPKIPIP